MQKTWSWSGLFSTLIPIFVLAWLLWSRIPLWWQHWKLEGTMVPQFLVTDELGKQVLFPVEPTKKQVVIFWASWCGPCKIELKRFQEALDSGSLPQGTIQTIAVWDEMSQAKAYIAKMGYTFPVYFTENPSLLKAYQVQATPTVVHLDKNQKIAWVTSGLSPLGIFRAQHFLTN